MSFKRNAGMAVAVTAGVAGVLIMSTLPAQAQPGDRGGNGGNGGGFVVSCGFSHSASTDPIVMPGHAGMSHLHEFFGNTTTNEKSTGASLLTGSTTCDDRQDLSAYWVPALLQNGVRVAPVGARVSYEGRGGGVTAFPAGFMAVSGRTDQTAAWGCATSGQRPVFSSSVAAVPVCSGAAQLVAQITFPQCWDGSSLDTANHISHLAFATEMTGQAPICPASHPVQVPKVVLEVRYPGAAVGGAGVTLSSGAASTLHADIFEAWSGTSLQDRFGGRGQVGQRGQAGQQGQDGGRGGRGARGTQPAMIAV